MPPTPLPGATVRSSAQVNEEIRALFLRRWSLDDAEREVYRALLEEWAAAVRAEATGPVLVQRNVSAAA